MTVLRFILCAGAITTLVGSASGNDPACKYRSLGSDVVYGGRGPGHSFVEIQGAIPTNNSTEIRISGGFYCGPGPHAHWPTEGMYSLSNRGAAWNTVDPADVHFYTVSAPSDARVLYQDRAPRDLHGVNFSRSEDGGKTWTTPKFRLQEREEVQYEGDLMVALQAISPHEPLTVFATFVVRPNEKSLADRAFPRFKVLGLYVSKDGGESWTSVSRKITGLAFANSWGSEDGNTPVQTAAFALSPSNPSTMYGYADGDIVKSIDTGRTWTPLSLDQELSRDRILTHGAKVEFANKVAFSDKPLVDPGEMGGADAGFQDYYLRQLGLPRQRLSQIIVDPTNENVVYVVAETGIYRTMDGGKKWVLLDLGFDELDGINSIAINQHDPTQIFVGTSEGLYTSHDRGCHFESIIIPPDALQCVAPK